MATIDISTIYKGETAEMTGVTTLSDIEEEIRMNVLTTDQLTELINAGEIQDGYALGITDFSLLQYCFANGLTYWGDGYINLNIRISLDMCGNYTQYVEALIQSGKDIVVFIPKKGVLTYDECTKNFNNGSTSLINCAFRTEFIYLLRKLELMDSLIDKVYFVEFDYPSVRKTMSRNNKF